VSYEAIRWVWDQPVKPAMRKLVLLAMADCVNAEAGEMVCWPSYSFIALRTGMNTKTVESSVFELKQEGYLVDTGRRAGSTGKVVVYRLNAPAIGAIKPGPQSLSANGTRPQNTPESGCVSTTEAVAVIPPNPAANPPKNDVQSPQKVDLTTPKQGVRTRKEPGTGTGKEPGMESAAAPSIPDVPGPLVADWMKVRKDKRAGPITDTVIEGLTREATKAGLTVADAVRYCCEAGWQGFNAGFYAKREGMTPAASKAAGTSKHAGFSGKNYREGVSEDGSFH
jgi:hypothetical protein